MMRWLLRILAVLALLVLAALATGWYLLAGSLPLLDGHLKAAGIDTVVTIERDKLGVVTVTAQDRTDLAWATGFVHGQTRFFQMDLQRRMAAGELAALFGSMALDTDLDHRRHRFRARDNAWLQNLPAGQRKLLNAYAAGVNTGLARLEVRPWEYLLLGEKPEPWRPVDTLLTVDAMSLVLNDGGDNERELDIARLHAVFPDALVEFLLAPAGRWDAPLQGGASPTPTIPPASIFDLRDQPRVEVASVSLPTQALPGSNNFAVAGRLADGAAIVANDMHLSLRVPNIWLRMRLRYRDGNGQWVDLNGVTLPGAPVLIAGSNGHIAWGFTNSYGDWLDWVRITLDPDNPDRYRVPGGWATIEEHTETIEVAGGEPKTLVVRETRWGPIMAQAPDGTPLALAWTAHRQRSHNLAIMQLEQAHTAADALAIAPTIGMPPQNFVVGDADGHIGWTLTGNALPRRAGFNPLFPADWSRSGTGWVSWTAPADFPRILDPANGRLWTANNRTTSAQWLALIGDGGYDLGARAQQIRDDLLARQHFTPDDMLAIQMDNRALFLKRWQKLLQATLKAHPEAGLDELQRLTANWTERAAADSVDYRLVRGFRIVVINAVLAPFEAPVEKRFEDFSWPAYTEGAVWTLVTQRPAWLLDPKYDNWDDLLLAAARKLAGQLGKQPDGLAARTWGEHHTAHICHPMADALPGFLARFLCMPSDELAGDSNMPRVLASDFGASERFGIIPGDEAASYLHMPGGQADNPLSPFFGAGHKAWVEGKATPLLPGPARHTLTLQPAPLQ